MADFHTEKTFGRGVARRANAAESESHATVLDDTNPTRAPFHWRNVCKTRLTPPMISLTVGEDTEAEAKGRYPAGRKTTAALSAHTDGKCTIRYRPS